MPFFVSAKTERRKGMKLDVIVVDWEATIGQPILAVDLIESYVWTNGKRRLAKKQEIEQTMFSH